MIFLTHDLNVENIEVFSSPSDHFLYINCYGLTLTSLWFNPGPSLTDSQSRLTGKKLEELSAGGSQPVPIWRVNTGPARHLSLSSLLSLGLNLRLAPGWAPHLTEMSRHCQRELSDLSSLVTSASWRRLWSPVFPPQYLSLCL